jgi:hypothetical protein
MSKKIIAERAEDDGREKFHLIPVLRLKFDPAYLMKEPISQFPRKFF